MGKLANIRQQALDNEHFRQVLETGKHTQIVIMHIPAGGEIGEETHADNDQVLYLVGGKGTVYLDGQSSEYNTGDLVLVPAGIKHNIVASSNQPLKIITSYSPPHHPDGTIHKTKAEAEAAG
ncbi:MAG: cupin domain-containing protein [Candidatus Saccharimonadales bacterium]